MSLGRPVEPPEVGAFHDGAMASGRSLASPLAASNSAGDTTGRLYGVFGPPTAYLIDRDGKLLGRIVGPRSWNGEAGRKLIEELLAAPAPKK